MANVLNADKQIAIIGSTRGCTTPESLERRLSTSQSCISSQP
jgi:hypothetical protein